MNGVIENQVNVTSIKKEHLVGIPVMQDFLWGIATSWCTDRVGYSHHKRYPNIEALQTLAWLIDKVKEHPKFEDWEWWNPPTTDDPEVYRLFARGKTKGLGLWGEEKSRSICRSIAPANFDELVDARAFIEHQRRGLNPVPWLERYCEGKKKRKAGFTPKPGIETVCGETNGVPLYFEQFELSLRQIGNLTEDEAKALQNAILRKMAPETILASRGKFIEHACLEYKYEFVEAYLLFDAICEFGTQAIRYNSAMVDTLMAYNEAYYIRYLYWSEKE